MRTHTHCVDRPHERILGTILVVVGVAILLFAFYHAYGLLGHLPSTQAASGPEAGFAYSVAGFTVTLTDQTHAGSAPVTSTYWQFSDGNSSGVQNTSHTYSTAGNYNVTLIVEDKSGNAAESFTNVHIGTGASSNGQGSPSLSPGGSIGSILGNTLGGSLGGIASIAETFILLTVIWLVGGSILKGRLEPDHAEGRDDPSPREAEVARDRRCRLLRGSRHPVVPVGGPDGRLAVRRRPGDVGRPVPVSFRTGVPRGASRRGSGSPRDPSASHRAKSFFLRSRMPYRCRRSPRWSRASSSGSIFSRPTPISCS